MADQCLNCFSTKLDAAGGCLSCGRKSDEQHPNSPNSSPELAEAFQRLVDLHDALTLTAEFNPHTDVDSFVSHAAEFDRASKFLRDNQHEALSSKNELPPSAPPVMGMEEMVDALKPFAAGVFNDNGDLTVRCHFEHDDVVRAYFVHRRLAKALSTPLVTGRDEQDGANAADAAPGSHASHSKPAAFRPSGFDPISQGEVK